MWFFFFFQAEDGIRDYKVTGVQTCALPICPPGWVDGPWGDVIPGEGLVRVGQHRGQDALARRPLAPPVGGKPVRPCGIAVVTHWCAPVSRSVVARPGGGLSLGWK